MDLHLRAGRSSRAGVRIGTPDEEAFAGLEGQGGPHCRWSCPGGAFGQERWETLLVAKTTSWRCLRGRLMIGIFVAVAVSRRDGGGGLSGLWFESQLDCRICVPLSAAGSSF